MLVKICFTTFVKVAKSQKTTLTIFKEITKIL